MTRQAKVVILGAGTAGLTALKEAQRYTDDVLLINAGHYGTTCARVGCMPSKALLEVAHAFGRRHWLAASGICGVEKLEVDRTAVMAHVRELRDRFVAGPIGTAQSLGENSIHGHPRFLDSTTLEVNGERIQAKSVVIATGTRPNLPEAWRSLGDRVVTSDNVFELEAPGRRLGVVGLGPIGVELGQAFAQLGFEVHAFTRGSSVAGLSDPEVNASLLNVLKDQMTVTTGADATLGQGDESVKISGGGKEVEVDWVLASLGRRPNIEGLGLENLGVELDKRGVPLFDSSTLRVGDLEVFIAGDISGLRPLLHEAADEGRIAAYHALHPEAACLKRRTPQAIVFTEPGAGYAGLTRAELPANGVVTGTADFTRQARALMAGRNAGCLKLYANESDGRLLGAEVVAPDAEHLLHLLAWSIQQNLSVSQLLEMPFYHPTVEEGLRSALQSARRELGVRRTQPDLPLCHEAADWALG
ncbi:dihydrolipoyl dehydrogenase [Pseudohalioglobus lutimaris]|uniref:Dihydrolipoyl dehydrogenase n=1 Tax=Pseudohalioglobus lutimaris TaxID=1737061 RepID=A0A2N5WYA7_9GAMM|nr:dihydrolipoyl dehydrogenase [Pseudohalioglobus lutimaris]PLW67221.1 dihydrolipoyl dehydrogenase [Pseudohalioglobus lutimaris]